jgi:hypothetical protein
MCIRCEIREAAERANFLGELLEHKLKSAGLVGSLNLGNYARERDDCKKIFAELIESMDKSIGLKKQLEDMSEKELEQIMLH